jgi:hypothetical protein
MVMVSVACAVSALPMMSAGAALGKTCFPDTYLPAVTLPKVVLPPTYLPAVTLPGGCVGDYCYPSRTIPARTIPGRTIPGRTIPGRTIQGACFDTAGSLVKVSGPAGVESLSSDFAPSSLRIRTRNYSALDRRYSSGLTTRYWSRSGRAASAPDVTATGFGEYNAAGYPKNEYVRPYLRRDGTPVSGYWRNSSSDSLPTCRVISC